MIQLNELSKNARDTGIFSGTVSECVIPIAQRKGESMEECSVKFCGENNWDAVVNCNSLDIEEEDDFEAFVVESGKDKSCSLEELDALMVAWKIARGIE